jgi:hypothetical protein
MHFRRRVQEIKTGPGRLGAELGVSLVRTSLVRRPSTWHVQADPAYGRLGDVAVDQEPCSGPSARLGLVHRVHPRWNDVQHAPDAAVDSRRTSAVFHAGSELKGKRAWRRALPRSCCPTARRSAPCSPLCSAVRVATREAHEQSAVKPRSVVILSPSLCSWSSSTPPRRRKDARSRRRRPAAAAAGSYRAPRRRRPVRPSYARSTPKIVLWRYVVAVGPSPGEVRPPQAFNSAVGDEQFRPRTTLLLPCCSFQGDFRNPGTSA